MCEIFSEYKLNQNTSNMKLKLIYLSGINMHQHCGTNMVNLSCMAMGKLTFSRKLSINLTKTMKMRSMTVDRCLADIYPP